MVFERRPDLVASRFTYLSLVLLLLGGCRIWIAASTTIQTMDEPLHVAAAVEWWRTGNILYPEQPPIARAFFAIWPQLSGASYNLSAGISEAGTDIFHTGGNYWKNLPLFAPAPSPFSSSPASP